MDVLVVIAVLIAAFLLGLASIITGGRIAKDIVDAQATAVRQVSESIQLAVREAVHSITAPPPLSPAPDPRTQPQAPHMAVYEDESDNPFPSPDDEYDPTDATIPPDRLLVALGAQDVGIEGFTIDPERYNAGQR